ncbi:MAG: hypothetical protein AB1424_08985 [Thermodesulfobacteriota bacterium]
MAKKLSQIRQQLQDAGSFDISGIVDSDDGFKVEEEAYFQEIENQLTYPILECPYSEYGGVFGSSFNVYVECDTCKIYSECKEEWEKDKSKPDKKEPKSGFTFTMTPVEFVNNIIRDNLTVAEIKILHRWHFYADKVTGLTWVSNTRIMDETRVSLKTMQRAINKFKDLGYYVDKGKHPSGTRKKIINLNPKSR